MRSSEGTEIEVSTMVPSRRLLGGALMLAVSGTLMTAVAQPAATPETTKAALVRTGGALYEGICAGCHGLAGDGHGTIATRAPIPDFTAPAAVARLSDERILKAIREGHDDAASAPWRARSDEEFAAVAAYIRETFMLPSALADVSLGKRLYARQCSVCHGDRGNGASWARNALNPPPFDFTSAVAKERTRLHLIETVTSGRPGTAMVSFTTRLAPDQIEAVVDYIRVAFIEGRAASPPDASSAPPVAATAAAPHALPLQPLRAAPAAPLAAMPPGIHQHGDAAHDRSPAAMSEPFPFDLAGDLARGRDLYSNNCVPCHGEQGNGQGPRAYFISPRPVDFTTAAARKTLNRPHLFGSIARGINGSEMPAWEKVLTPQQIADIGEYVFTTFLMPADATTPAASTTGTPAADQKKN
jgi:mono/diheme cytochrome c family protein